MAHEGLDIDRLNTIILATPRKNVVQAIGRILRKVLMIGDTRPLVVDFRDSLDAFSGMADKRELFYNKSEYIVEYYYIHDDEYISPKTHAEHLGITGNYNTAFTNDLNEVLKVSLV